ncbi:M56 family metallopeptidase [Acidicapsa dinghuensis]|uniref:M56 family metallopeptidase n=1 Tax=Acidicapsa dinghuensis TaxID=2218256 RepID=A0ABW1EF46_9BACT|nr:M56 family metallopeptidase [Acidicapsa dinghuensis]
MQEMAWMHEWLTREESLALGWTLLHFCWQGAAIAAVFAVVDRITVRAQSGVRYLVALAALGLMPLAVIATFAKEMHSFAVLPSAVLPEASGLATGHPLLLPAAVSAMAEKAVAAPAQQWWLDLHAERILPWLDVLWLLGVVLLAVRALGGLRQLERLRRSARRAVPPALEENLRAVCARLRVTRRVALRISDEVISPMAMGVWRATILLPVSAAMFLAPEELEAILAHELGHIRRWDYACNLVQTALETVLFFHPAVWWLSKTVRYRREVCCDEIAVASCSDALVYAQTLLRLEEQKIEHAQLAMALHGNGSLLGRVKKILGEEGQMENRMTSGVRVAVAGVVLLGLTLGPKWNAAVAAVSPAVHHSIAAIAAVTQSVAPKPAPGVKVDAAAKTDADVTAKTQTDVTAKVETDASPDSAAEGQDAAGSSTDKHSGTSYIEGMREAGYAMDLNKDFDTLVSIKSVGVTPEYAKQMASVGYGKPTAHELMSLKAMGITPEYLAEMKQSGLAPKDLHEAISEKAVGVTPEYSREMAQSGFTNLDVRQLISLKAQGVTPEYIQQMDSVGFGKPTAHEVMSLKALGVTPEYLAEMKQSGLAPKDLHEAMSEKAVGVTPEYARQMKQSGLGDMNVEQLISLKAQGMTPEYVTWLKKEFPQITVEELKKAAVFHLDDKFLADARSHGFDGKDIDKLLRLKMSGLLDE